MYGCLHTLKIMFSYAYKLYDVFFYIIGVVTTTSRNNITLCFMNAIDFVTLFVFICNIQ